MMQQKIKFYIEYDKSYSHSFASGLQVSSVNNRFDLSFHYEMAHVDKEVITTVTSQGKVEQVFNKADTIEIDRLIKSTISIDRKTAENLVDILQEQLKQS